MMKCLRLTNYLVAACALLSPTAGLADDGQKQKMAADIDTIKEIFFTNYAPKYWKASFAGWDMEAEADKAKAKILGCNHMSLKDYQRTVRDLLGTSMDYHVGVQFFSTESASLPFQILGAEGRYFIVHIDRDTVGLASFPFEEGDEVISFNDRPISEVITQLREEEVGFASQRTDMRLAEMYLTRRVGALGHRVPRGSVIVGVRTKNGQTHKRQLIWDYNEEKIQEFRPDPYYQPRHEVELASNEVNENGLPKLNVANHPFVNLQMTPSFFKPLSEQLNDTKLDGHGLGESRSYLPRLGKVIWDSGWFNPFDAYICKDETGRRVGYIRIPHYSAGSFMAFFFQSIMEKMSDSTDMLVIDQLNNPGGSVLYLYGLVSMLIDQPVSAPKHEVNLTQEDIAWALEVLPILRQIRSDDEAQWVLGPDLGGYPVSLQFVKFFIEYLDFTISEWNGGRRLTHPTHLLGVDYINPHPEVNYTKPILLVVNSACFSGGDFFPAILQDNDRVTVLGTTTAGAGGAVGMFKYPNQFGVAGVRFTMTLAERANGNPIENLGVTPDEWYELSAADVQGNYEGFVGAINAEIEKMVEPGGAFMDIDDDVDTDDDDDDDFDDGDDDFWWNVG